MNYNLKTVSLTIISAVASSLCCITPVAAFFAGASGVASTFSWVEPFRPYLIGLTLLILGFAWYQKLKPKSDIECECEDEPSMLQSKGLLGTVTIVVGLLLAFPSYSDAFFPSSEKTIIYVQESQVKTINLTISGLTCDGCSATVNNVVQRLEGVLETDVSHETGKATIKYDQEKTNLAEITETINKTGFKVVESVENSTSGK